MSGCEWVVEAHGCDPASLTDLEKLQSLFTRLIADLSLHPIDEPHWHKFPGAGGITGVTLLSESHIACHTFPEHRSLCLNLFCCRPRREWDFVANLESAFSAAQVHVRRIERPYA